MSTSERPDLPLPSVPSGLTAVTFCVDDQTLAVFSFPLEPPALPASLSAAERDVARLLLDGKSNHQIATSRRTSQRTIANQVASIFRKTGVQSRAEFIAVVERA